MNRKLDELVRRLRDDAEAAIDYPTIAAKSERLGFPTSVRTLRFYVSEGILPPPRKSGKSPVYPEDWILSALLAIHLMKGRFQRTLAEIRTILEGLTDEPERLAEKCVELHELERTTPPAQYRRLVERFFALLSGGAGGALGREQPSAVSLAALLAAAGEEIPLEASGADGAGELRAPRGFGFRYGSRGSARGDANGDGVVEREEERGRAERRERGSAARGPGRDADDARRLENVFIRHFESAFSTLERVWHPPSASFLRIGKGARTPRVRDDYERVARYLLDERVFARDLFECLPLQKSTVFEVCQRGLAGRRVVAVVAANWSPIPELVRDGRSDRALGYPELGEVIARLGVDEEAAVFLGVHAPCGIAADVKTGLSRGLARSAHRHGEVRLAVAECDAAGEWRLWHDFPGEAAALAALFDPQGDDERLESCARRLAELDALQVRGGFVELEVLARSWEIEPRVLVAAAQRLAATGDRFRVERVGGSEILKRGRLSGPA